MELLFRVWGGFPKNWGYLFKGSCYKVYSMWGLYWDPLILGNYHVGVLPGNLRILGKKMETTI